MELSQNGVKNKISPNFHIISIHKLLGKNKSAILKLKRIIKYKKPFKKLLYLRHKTKILIRLL